MKINYAIILIALLQQVSFCQNFHKAEVFTSSNDYYNGGIIIDSVKTEYTDANNYLHFKTVSGKVFSYNKNSIWGYRSFGLAYRRWEDSNWMVHRWMPLGIGRRDTVGLIIYAVSGSKGTSYYFSKTLDSKIYRLNRGKVKKVFKDDKIFLEALSKQIKWYQGYYDIDKVTEEYKIKMIYKKCKS